MKYLTSDLAFSAFLCMRGLRLLSATRTNTGRFEFVFEDPDSKADALHLEFLTSEFPMFDNFIKILKRRIYKN